MKKIIILILLTAISNNLNAEIEYSIQDRINNAELIFIGNPVSYYEQLDIVEHKVGKKTKTQNYICPIYNFSVNEILKGNYNKETIGVKILDECEKVANNFSSYSEGEIIENEGHEKGQSILFLKKDLSKNYYYSLNGFDSSLMVHGSIEVITNSNEGLVFIKNKNSEQDIMNLNDLRNMISKEKTNEK